MFKARLKRIKNICTKYNITLDSTPSFLFTTTDTIGFNIANTAVSFYSDGIHLSTFFEPHLNSDYKRYELYKDDVEIDELITKIEQFN